MVWTFPEGKRKVITLSYDDGTVADRELVDILNQHGLKGTFHLNSGKLDQEGNLDSEEIAELFTGHEVACHTVSHPHLPQIPRQRILQELLDDRRALEELVGYPVTGFSYPYGEYSQEVIELLKAAGIEYARTIETRPGWTLPEDYYRWGATCHHNDDLLEKTETFLNYRPDRLRLFYIWGHSHEFDRDDNWDVISEFGELTGECSNEIWFATNREVLRYVNAARSLILSADCTTLVNPSAVSVWIADENGAREAGAGQLLDCLSE